jgi:hypothetical protein
MMFFHRRRKTRLCVCLGTWQLITLAAALREEAKRQRPGEHCETVLLLFELNPIPDLRESMTALAPCLWPWDRIVWDNGLLKWRPRDEEWPWPMSSYAPSIREHVGLVAPDEIWLCHFEVVEHRILMETYPRANVVLFEDGLHVSSSPMPLMWTRGDIVKLIGLLPALVLRRKLKNHLASLRVANWRLSTAYAKRVSRVWYYLVQDLPVPAPFDRTPTGLVETSTLLDTLKAVRESPVVMNITSGMEPAAERDVLFLYQIIEGDHERELKVYKRTVARLLEKGYRVFWKDHPRTLQSLFPELAAVFPAGSFQRLALPFSWPAELVTAVLSFQQCVGLAASSLFYMPHLFGTRVYSFADTLISEISETYAKFLGLSVVMAHVPNLEAMPDLGR